MAWFLKFSLKIFLNLVPVDYSFWRKLKILNHGDTQDGHHAEVVVERVINYAKSTREFAGELPTNFRSLELGPGDSLNTGYMIIKKGASRASLLDTAPYASSNIESFQDCLADYFCVLPRKKNVANLSAFHNVLGLEYKTEGLADLAKMPTECFDFVWSQVVLEHVDCDSFEQTILELRRVTKTNGIHVHCVDFRDHLSGGLNNLRFSKKFWESKAVKTSSAYTNRISPSQMIAMFERSGFQVKVTGLQRWEQPPISYRSISKDLGSHTSDDLLIKEFVLLAVGQ